MTEKVNTSYQVEQNQDGEIDLTLLIKLIWQGKIFIITTTIIFILGSVYYAKSLPNIYKSEVLVAPISDKKDAFGGLAQLSSIASFAGLNTGSSGSIDKVAIAIETLKSRVFLIKFIENHKLENKLFKDQIANRSLLSSCAKLQSMLNINVDNKTKLIRVSIEHESPELAKQIVSDLIVDINQNMKNKDLEEAKRSIDYLNNQISQTNLEELRNVLFQLIEEQTKILMLVNVRSEYIFKTIDPAIVPDQKIKPVRSTFCLIGSLLGFVLSIAFLFLRNAYFDYSKKGN